MKYAILIPLALAAFPASSFAQDRIFRCANNEYTNNATDAEKRGCKAIEGGNVTVVQGTRVNGTGGAAAAAPGVKVANAPQAGQRVDSAEPKARDADSRAILESELKKAESRQAELVKEYNNGEPDKRGDEARNYQKYLDRVAELKAGISRNENDMAGIKRELGRLPK
jgi:hypothetical protein